MVNLVEGTKTPEQIAGERIREIRTAQHMTQAALARAMQTLGYKWLQTTAAKTEAAERPLRLNEAADLARVLGVDVCDLLEMGSAVDPKILAADAMLRVAAELTAAAVVITDSAGLTDAAEVRKDTDGER